MINLVPTDLKAEYKFARSNTRLLHMVAGIGLGIMGLVVIAAAGYFYMQISARHYESQSAELQAELTAQKQPQVSAEIQDISSRLKLAVDVLSKEVMYSEFLKQLAVVTPSGVALTNINISQYGGAITITANAQSYESASQLQVNLIDPANKIFENADILNIACEAGSDERYPCTVSVRALFAKNNPFLFINDGATR